MYNWYKVLNVAEFSALGLVSREVDLILEDIGLETILVTKGNLIGVIFQDVYLCPELNGRNPFEFESRAAYIDDNDDLWVGVLIED